MDLANLTSCLFRSRIFLSMGQERLTLELVKDSMVRIAGEGTFDEQERPYAVYRDGEGKREYHLHVSTNVSEEGQTSVEVNIAVFNPERAYRLQLPPEKGTNLITQITDFDSDGNFIGLHKAVLSFVPSPSSNVFLTAGDYCQVTYLRDHENPQTAKAAVAERRNILIKQQSGYLSLDEIDTEVTFPPEFDAGATILMYLIGKKPDGRPLTGADITSCPVLPLTHAVVPVFIPVAA